MEVVVTTGAVSRAKLQSNHRHQHSDRNADSGLKDGGDGSEQFVVNRVK